MQSLDKAADCEQPGFTPGRYLDTATWQTLSIKAEGSGFATQMQQGWK